MGRIAVACATCLLTMASAHAQLGQPQPGEGPSVAHAIPMSYVGGSGRMSLSIDDEGNSTGEALGVFDNTGEHAWIGQLWWGDGGAGGVQLGYNWLWGGMSLAEAKAHPDQVTVARSMIAIDQNPFKDRKLTLGFGIERPDYFIDAYLSTAASDSRAAGARSTAVEHLLQGNDAIGSYQQVETVTTIDGYATQAYDGGIGVRAGHFSDPLALRLHAGMDYQRGGGGAHVFTVSAGADKYLGTRGWSLSGLVEHDESSTDPLLGTSSDTRFSLFLRYEFGGRVFVPTSELATPAWIARALVNAPSSHPRVVQTYTRHTGATTTSAVGPKQYTNHNPLARDDAASTVVGAGVLAIDVLANDSDVDGDALVLVAVTPAAHGHVAIAGGLVTYTPAAGFEGSDRFTYSVGDGRGGSASAVVSVAVGPRPNQPPVARDDAASTLAGTPVAVPVLANDSDPDGDPIVVTAISQPAHGSVSGGADGRLTYVPQAGFTGTDQFTYTIADGRGGTASATVVVAVLAPANRFPRAIADAAITQAGQPVLIDVLANDSDPDGDALVVASVGQPGNGSVQLHGDGSLTYTPVAGFAGTDRFSYVVADGRGGTDSARVTVTVLAAANAAPVAIDDYAAIAPVSPIVPTVAVPVLANDSDPDGDPLTVTAVTQGLHGSVVILPDQRVQYTWDGNLGPPSDQFTYTIGDGRGGVATATVTLSLPLLNMPPVAVADSFAVDQATAYAGTNLDVLANDSDGDGDPLQVIAVTQPAIGTVAIVANQVFFQSAVIGTAVFTYTIDDGRGGTATTTVTVDVF